jgi:very-short-patch-repair endonuclease
MENKTCKICKKKFKTSYPIQIYCKECKKLGKYLLYMKKYHNSKKGKEVKKRFFENHPDYRRLKYGIGEEKFKREKLFKKGFKYCPHCEQVLSVKNFNKDKSQPKGIMTFCKSCKKTTRNIIKKICFICKKEFYSYNRKTRFCSRKCSGNWHGKIFKGKNHPNYKEKPIKYCIECNKKLNNKAYLFHTKRCHSCDTKNKFKDLNYKIKMITLTFKALKIKPNKPEKLLLSILSNLFQNQYKYVGNGKVIIDGFNPDFINKKDRKIIELFGDYWHNIPSAIKRDKGRIACYLKKGYKLLIIWEHELENLKKVAKKLIKFDLQEIKNG